MFFTPYVPFKMDGFAVKTIFILSLVDFAEAAVKCHDCSSWNPYCQETVDKPFDNAVATADCQVTSTCYLRQDSNGDIHRGCADGWRESRVDVTLMGCHREEGAWLGQMIWCFCQEDYCNGGSVATMSIAENPHAETLSQAADLLHGEGEEEEAEEEDYVEEEEEEEEEEVWEEVDDREGEEEEEEWTNEEQTWQKNEIFSDVSSEGKLSDQKYRLWYWHADSDRPHRIQEGHDGEESWVDSEEGKGWDFPVTATGLHYSSEEEEDYDHHDHAEEDDDVIDDSASADNTVGVQAWGEEEENAESEESKPSLTRGPQEEEDGDSSSSERPDSDERIAEVANYDFNAYDVFLRVRANYFFCWDCNSQSPLCRETVETQMANHLGKTSCPATRKCFVRSDGEVTYRGCADGWVHSMVDTGYVGCRVQPLYGRDVEWCFCTASLCNGDSTAHVQHKYAVRLQPYWGHLPSIKRHPQTTVYRTKLLSLADKEPSLGSPPATPFLHPHNGSSHTPRSQLLERMRDHL